MKCALLVCNISFGEANQTGDGNICAVFMQYFVYSIFALIVCNISFGAANRTLGAGIRAVFVYNICVQ